MRRSRAFILSEVLMTILLQAGFILVLCMSFYLFLDFYTRTQQILTARNHAERVIQFMDDKVRHAGLGFWDCTTPSQVRSALGTMGTGISSLIKDFRLPVAIRKMKTNDPKKSDSTEENAPIDGKIYYGNIVTMLYADGNNGSEGNDTVMTYVVADAFNLSTRRAKIKIIDNTSAGKKLFNNSAFMKNSEWAVSESIGRPFYIPKGEIKDYSPSLSTATNMNVYFYGTNSVVIPNAGELMLLKCVSMFVRLHPKDEDDEDDNEDEDRQFTYLELSSDGNSWSNYKYQEKGILDIYMTLDTTTNIFTLYVLGSGGEDPSANNPRPEAWPKEANPAGEGSTDEEKEKDAKTKWLAHNYSHHTVYVARKSWKLNNIPEGFRWN